MQEFLPFIIIGLTTGSVIGLGAVGLVVTYKTSGIFNFAQGSLAALSVYIYYSLSQQHGVSTWVSWIIALVVGGPVCGLLLELLARRLADFDHIVKITSMVGIVIGVIALGTILYQGSSPTVPAYLPTDTYRLGSVAVGWDQTIIFLIALVATIGLYLFLRFSRLGIAMRAVVDDPLLTSVVGQSPVTVRRWAWLIGSTFAALSGLLLAPSLNVDGVLLTELVIQAFGAAAIGYFTNLPLAYLGGIVVGIGGALATKYSVSVSWLANLPGALPFVVLTAVLILLPKRLLADRRFVLPRRAIETWRVPARVRTLFAVALVVLAVFLPNVVGTKLVSFSAGLVAVVLLLSLGLLTRLSGQVSLAQYGLAAVGGAVMARLTMHDHVPWLLALLLAGLIAIPLGAIIAIPAIRLSGVFLALATLGFGIGLEQLFYTTSLMFGQSSAGLPATRPHVTIAGLDLSSDRGYFYLLVVFVVVIALFVAAVGRSRLGRLLRALKDSPTVLETSGASANTSKVIVFCISSFIAAIAGGLLVSLYNSASPNEFTSFSSLTLLTLVVIITFQSPWYAVVGGLALNVIPGYITSGNVSQYLNVLFGVAAILIPFTIGLSRGVPRFARQPLLALDSWLRLGRRAARREPVSALHAAPARRLPATNGRPLELTNLTIRYGGNVAVENLNLTIAPGGITGLIGPNGAGKTSTFNACSGLLRSNSGVVIVNGLNVSRKSPALRARRGLGRTFQRVQLCQTLSVADNIALGRECSMAGSNPFRQLLARRADRASVARAVHDAAEMVGIVDLLDREVATLSTGERRLVELARVLAGPFDVILLDEPSSGLDRAETSVFAEMVKRVVQERHLSALVVEHDMSLVRDICDKVYVLDFGRLIFEGTASEMLASPLVHAAYLGSSADVIDKAIDGEVRASHA